MCDIKKQTEETDVNELVHRMRRLRPSGFAIITQHLVSLVVLHFPHFHTNAAESSAPYFIQGCKYYINCSRPISVRSMPQTELLLGFAPSPASHSVLRQPEYFIKTGWGHTRLSDICALMPNPVDCSLWSPPSFVELSYCL